ncbi:tetratricopeptide repeat protein [Pseudobdellovibrio exovorus]|uniref:Adventurous gliding motility protein U n=1 Tax=Pseudobdellovibrio exovorus JSS TaxID=1184267 RepID=M4VAD3_9BACT|nr:tetratricopeptide repeat protein [Pseudobdellovibrio exovorus]AGH96367.1 hypothetical protein A11Q_2151 [Pseudobdellovibrio exovorus JSS]
MKKIFFLAVCFLLVDVSESSASNVKGAVNFEGETLSFELSGQQSWDYDLKRVKSKGQTKVQLEVKSADQQALEQIRNVKNPFVESIQIAESPDKKKWLVEFILKNDRVETFDYLTDQPSKLIVDFYKSEAPIAAQEEKPKATAKTAATTKSEATDKAADRRPADVDILRIDDPAGIETSVLAKAGLYDAGDAKFARFAMKESEYNEDAIIKSRSNYYLKFPILESEFSFWKKMKENPPVYEVQPEKTEENKQARLLRTLFNRKKYLVFLQTADWFAQKYPQSRYHEMVAFMKGDAFVELWKEEQNDAFYEQAQNAYREALTQYPESQLSERTSLLTGMLAIDKADYMSAIRRLNLHIENKKYANKISKLYAQLGLSYGYSRINKLPDALAVLNEVEKNTKDKLVLAEVAVRRGDFNFFGKKFDEATGAYDQAIKKHPLVSQLFPSAYFNKMEAQFWKEKYRESHQSALDFAQNFPTHDFAPYALTRVGELLDIMGAEQTKSVGAYLETHFRYGDSPKTIVARLHLLSTKMKSMKNEELEPTLKKMDELAEKSDLPNIDQFKVVMVADGFARRQNYLKAIDILSKFYQQNPNRPDVKQVTNRIAKNISDEIKQLADNQQFHSLLKTYRQYADTWLKTHSRIDTDYFLGLAYDSAGAYEVALEKYRKVLGNLNQISGKPEEKVARVNQYLPSFDSLYLKLANGSYNNVAYQDAYHFLDKIQNPLKLSESEQVERVQLASHLYEQRGDSSTSARYLKDLSGLWQGNASLALPVNFKLAEMQVGKSEFNEAIGTYEKCRTALLADENPQKSDLVKLANEYSQLLISQGKSAQAIDMLSSLLKKHGAKYGMNQERYLLGDLHFKAGEIKKAENAWSFIEADKGGVWKQLADEKMKQASWDVDYKKHLKRIPAMSQFGEQQ